MSNIAARLFIDWSITGSYVNESANLVAASGEMRLAAPDSQITSPRGTVDQCTLTLRNPAGRYSPLNTSGALYASIGGGKAYHAPMYLEISINGGSNYTRVFTGVIKLPKESGLSTRENPLVTIDCRSRDELLLQKRLSTTHADFRTWIDEGYTEAEVIREILLDAGLSAPDYTLDPGLFNGLTVWLDDESPLEDIWTLAAACGGRFYCDADGEFRYENAQHWLFSPHMTSQETLTPDTWQKAQAVYDDRELYDTVTVEYAARIPEAAAVLWEPDEPVVIPAGGTVNITARLRQPGWTINAPSYTAVTTGGQNITDDVSASATKYAQRVDLVLTNSNATYAAHLRPLEITGQPLVGGPTGEKTRTSAADGTNSAFFVTRGGRTRSLRGNVYIQQGAQADMLAQFLLHRQEYPRLVWTLSGCPGKATRRPGDRITVNDTSMMSAGRAAIITGIRWRYGDTFVQDIEAIDAANLYPYAGATPGYFVVGTNKLGAADALRGRVFY